MIFKKAIFPLYIALLFGVSGSLKAQCYGTVNYDQNSAANGTSSFSISTTFCDELIMIAYDGWRGPGTGPVTVDGNPATHINTANCNLVFPSTGAAETYAYLAPTAGVHNIVCTETGYSYIGNTAYDMNFACAFYATGTVNPLSIGSLTSVETTISCNTGGPITDNITTTIPNSMIFSNVLYNDGVSSADPISWTGGTFLATDHVGYGIEGSDAYTACSAAALYTITATNTSPNNTSACGGIAMVLVAIPPPLCGTPLAVAPTSVNPACGNNNGSISLAVTGGIAPYTYLWTPAVSTTDVATGLSAGTYSITVSDAACGPNNDTSLVVVLTGPAITLTANVTANEKCNGNCNGSATAVFTGGTPPFTYNWTPSGGTNATATGLCAGSYTITAIDSSGCTHVDSIVITQPAVLTAPTTVINELCNGGSTGSSTVIPAGGTLPYTYTWTPGGQTNATASGLSAGNYTITVTDSNSCTASSAIVITEPSALTLSLSGPQIICSGQSGTLTSHAGGGTSPYTYSWSNGETTDTASIMPTATTTYTLFVTDANGCTKSSTITVVLGVPMVVAITGPTSTCYGESVTLCSNVTGGTGGFTYSWEPGNIIGSCITVTPSSSTVYTLTVGDNCGSSITTTASVIINPLPLVSFDADIYQGCSPLCIQFRDLTTLSSGQAVSWSWLFGNGDSTNTESPIYCYPNPGNYSVNLTVVSDSGCSSTLRVLDMITVYTHPVAGFTMSPQPTDILSPTIQFTDKSTDQYGIAYWFWNFGDGSGKSDESSLENPSHTYSDTGTYCARLVAMNIHGCVDTVTDCLVIDPIFNLYIPSAFTPNGDGKNDVFMPVGSYIKNFSMYIFDRWGMQLFHTTNINNGWTGTVNGSSTICQEDTYVYQIYVTDSYNKPHTYIGEVNLIK